jgi:hypothetical protein
MFFGILLFLIAVFLLILVIFKDQISESWEYLKKSLQKVFGMNPPNNETKEQTEAIRADDIESPMPTTLDVAYEARQDGALTEGAELPQAMTDAYASWRRVLTVRLGCYNYACVEYCNDLLDIEVLTDCLFVRTK